MRQRTGASGARLPEHRRRRCRHLAQDASAAAAQSEGAWIRTECVPHGCPQARIRAQLRYRSLPVFAGHLHGAAGRPGTHDERGAASAARGWPAGAGRIHPPRHRGQRRLPPRLSPPVRRRGAGALQTGGALDGPNQQNRAPLRSRFDRWRGVGSGRNERRYPNLFPRRANRGAAPFRVHAAASLVGL